ncbi:MAG TPA: hypothetical protein DEF51_27510 [Myxococcales bacterium]|nr:hypothetical protein [Myxococcales bacterium]
MTRPAHDPEYIPALRYRFLTRLYDPVVALTTREREFKGRLIDEVTESRGRILDLGCGTGTLTIELAKRRWGCEVHGLDGDPEALGIARRKAERADVEIIFHEGLAQELPLPSSHFDVVVSSLVFHHLSTDVKRQALERVADVLVPGGRLLLVDWGRPHGPFMRAAFVAVQLLDGFATTTDNVRGRLPGLMAEAGLVAIRRIERWRAPLGTIELYEASAP